LIAARKSQGVFNLIDGTTLDRIRAAQSGDGSKLTGEPANINPQGSGDDNEIFRKC
jgi:hypothetical protein